MPEEPNESFTRRPLATSNACAMSGSAKLKFAAAATTGTSAARAGSAPNQASSRKMQVDRITLGAFRCVIAT